jgi:hypothetical protein
MTMIDNIPRPRKNLADQIDRLDSILDGLSEGLNEAVATAVKEAVTTGVQQAVVEVLTNADLQQLLRPPAPPTPPAAPAPPESSGGGGFLAGLWRGLKGTAAKVGEAAGRAARGVGNWLAATGRKARDLMSGGVKMVRRGACALHAAVLSSRVAQVVGVGAVIAVGCCLAHPALAGVVAGVAAAAAAAVSQLPAYVLALLDRTATAR